MAMQKVLANEMETLTAGLMAQEAKGLKDACLRLGFYLCLLVEFGAKTEG